MTDPINPNFRKTFGPPVMQARDWTTGVDFSPERPLMNFSQAAPLDPPPYELRQAIAEFALNDASAHLYGPVLGLPDLRAHVAQKMAKIYAGKVQENQIAITSGCNQAFTAAIATLAETGDEIILPTPWYFNHKMHLDMSGIKTIALPTDAQMLPDPDQAKQLITSRTKAIVLVTPNNPTGAEYPTKLVQQFYDLAKSSDIALVVDETYRDFDSRSGAPHKLFADPNWDETLIQLYSFSKAYRLTGHRVGTIAASVSRLAEVEKYLDTVTICPNQIAQHAALWGLRNLDDWLASERLEILDRRDAISENFSRLGGWRLMGLGAYFAYVSHPFKQRSNELAPALVKECSVLLLPGTMFRPPEESAGQREIRIAFANADRQGIHDLFTRLENLTV